MTPAKFGWVGKNVWKYVFALNADLAFSNSDLLPQQQRFCVTNHSVFCAAVLVPGMTLGLQIVHMQQLSQFHFGATWLIHVRYSQGPL